MEVVTRGYAMLLVSPLHFFQSWMLKALLTRLSALRKGTTNSDSLCRPVFLAMTELRLS
jgi:hypothetical protein